MWESQENMCTGDAPECYTGETFSVAPTQYASGAYEIRISCFQSPPGCTGFDFNPSPPLVMVNRFVILATVTDCKG